MLARMMRLPSGTRRAAGGEPASESRGASAPPTLAPRTSARASGTGNAPAAASDITSSTTDRLECTSQVIPAATRNPRIGSPASPVSIERIGKGFLQRPGSGRKMRQREQHEAEPDGDAGDAARLVGLRGHEGEHADARPEWSTAI